MMRFVDPPKNFSRSLQEKSFDAFARYQEPLFNQQALFQFEQERQECLSAVASTLVDAKGVTLPSFELLIERLSRKFETFRAQWRSRFQGLLNNTATLVGSSVAGELQIPYRTYGPKVQEIIEERLAFISTSIPSTTYAGFLHTMRDGWEKGENREQLYARANLFFLQGYSAGEIRVPNLRARSRLFAQTETVAITNGAALAAVIDSGKDYEKEWNTMGDEKVRDAHAAQDRERRNLDEPFTNGYHYPQEPNCRCWLLFYRKKKSRS